MNLDAERSKFGVVCLVRDTYPAATEVRDYAIVRDRFASHLGCVAVPGRTSYVPSFVPAGRALGVSRLSLLDQERNE
jgi:hypothetical protein